MANKPDFIIAGAARTGSTMLAGCLIRHPDIYMPTPFIPEPKIFTDVGLRNIEYLKRYEELYYGRKEKVKGEKTVNYLEIEGVADKIRRVLPDVKLIFILRNPIERAISNWFWSVRNDWEKLSFEEAIEKEYKRYCIVPQGLKTSPFNYLHRGRYDELLDPYFKLFPSEQILIIKYESMINNVQLALNKIFVMLNIKEMEIKLDGVNCNEVGREGFTIKKELKEQLQAYYKIHTVRHWCK